ncbi:MAG: VWA domain-containing protein [Methylococcaceae bacterium]|nr:VWA domain-containing protein [Methylococcaceae bacterium]
MIRTFKPLTVLLLLLMSRSAFSIITEPGGTIETMVDGKKISFPLLKTDLTANVKGDLVTVTVKQTFTNPSDKPLHATYLFPLNQHAAVQRMVMDVGDERVEAKIQRIEEAITVFDNAKQEGKAAALLTEQRPNMFTQKIANLMPKMPVQITLTYCHTLPKVDGQYELVLPLVVGPRYQSAGSGKAPEPDADINSKSSFGQWEVEKLPAYPEVAGLNSPDIIDKERVSIRVELDGGLPITELSSKTHAISVEKPSINQRIIQLANGKTIDNKDFVLRYKLSGNSTQAGLLAHKDDRGGFFSIQLEPPALPAVKDIAAREMVFVLDTSGSMDGEPIAASKVFMKHALNNLHSNDYFRIIRFSKNAEEFTTEPVAATAENIKAGLHYVESLTADGGTEIPSAIEQAFAKPPIDNTLRLVVFLTDGYIGNESEVLTQISEKIASARIYALGVGTSVNRFLLEEMAAKGRGFTRFIDPTEKSDDAAIQLAGRLESPVLTDIVIDWGDLEVSETSPVGIPDLFAGSAVRIMGKYKQSGRHTIKISGLVNGRKAQLPLTVDLPDASNDLINPIPIIWARTQIADAMRLINTPSYMRRTTDSENSLKEKVTALGLDFSLTSQWTAFVAVSQKIVNAHPEQAEDKNVPLPRVKGITGKAYGENPGSIALAQPVMLAQNFSGGATPEPSTFAGLCIMAILGGWTLYRSRKPEVNSHVLH